MMSRDIVNDVTQEHRPWTTERLYMEEDYIDIKTLKIEMYSALLKSCYHALLPEECIFEIIQLLLDWNSRGSKLRRPTGMKFK